MLFALILNTTMNTLLHNCAPEIGAQTMGGIIEYESGWHPWAIGDNTTHQSYFLSNKTEAVYKAESLLAIGHNLDVGYAQVNSENFAGYGLNPQTAFDPCTNVHTGAAILAGDYAGAVRKNWIGHPIASSSDIYYQEQYALVHSLSAYNSGGYWASMKYGQTVYGLAQDVHIQFAANVVPKKYRSLVAPQQNYVPIVRRSVIETPQLHAPTAESAKYAAGPSGRIVTFQPAWLQGRPIRSASKILMSNSDSK